MNKQYFNPEKDGFYGVYYPSPTPSRKAFIAMLGASSDDRMVVSGVKWLQPVLAGKALALSALRLPPSRVLEKNHGGCRSRRRPDCQSPHV